MNPKTDILTAEKYQDLPRINYIKTFIKDFLLKIDDEGSILLDENRRKSRKSLKVFQMFCNWTGLDSNEFTVSLQKSKSLSTGVAFREKLELRKNI